jgi:phage terminase small subunit
MPISPKQQRFADEYLVDLNATQAAIRAGYSEKTAAQQGHQLLQKTSVRDAIEAGRAQRAERTAVTADRVIAELAAIATTCARSTTFAIRRSRTTPRPAPRRSR